jgi:hypothetical protein
MNFEVCQAAQGGKSMNKYTFNWNLKPAIEAEYAFKVPPFEVVARGDMLTLTATADAAEEQRLGTQADEVAHDLARALSYEHGKRFEVAYQGSHVLLATGQQRVSATFQVIVKPAVSVKAEVRDTSGNVVDNSALQREQERQAMQQRITDLARRAARDPNLRDMLDHRSRYVDDPDGRLHPLYDVLQVAERLYDGRKEAATALNLSIADLSNLGRISNDPTVLNGRHPGKATGPRRIATKAEVNTCERVARAIIENYAAKIVI